jgi:hypothetical protein
MQIHHIHLQNVYEDLIEISESTNTVTYYILTLFLTTSSQYKFGGSRGSKRSLNNIFKISHKIQAYKNRYNYKLWNINLILNIFNRR